MSGIEEPSITRPSTVAIQARSPHREIAELLAAAIVRMRTRDQSAQYLTDSEVSLGFSAQQSVNANPSYTEGVQQ